MRDATELELRPARVDAGDGAVLYRAMAAEIAVLYDGLDHNGPDMPKAGPTELSPPTGGFWVGYVDGEPVCCGGVKRLPDDGAAEIKRMWVIPRRRRQGIARTVLAELERTAAAAGCRRTVLETGDRQPEAVALYRRVGYRPMPRFGVYREEAGSLCFCRDLDAGDRPSPGPAGGHQTL